VREYLRSRWALRTGVLRLFPLVGMRLVALAIALQLLAGLLPVAFIVATSAVVGRIPAAVREGLDSPEWRSLRDALLLAGGMFVLQQAAAPLQWTVSQLIYSRVDDALRERATAASFGAVGVAVVEDEEAMDTLGDLIEPWRGTGFSPGSATVGTLYLIPRYVQWAVASVFVGIVYTWWAALAVASGALALRVAIRTGFGHLQRVERTRAPERRRSGYYRNLVVTPEAAKEVRVFDLLSWIRDRYAEQALAAVEPVWRVRRRSIFGAYTLASPIWLALSAVAVVGAARAAAGGSLTLGELAYVLQAIALVGSLGTVMEESDFQTEHGLRAFEGLEQLEERAAAEARLDGTSAEATGRPRSEIRFEGVTFGYDAARPVLRNLELAIPAGRSLALVGLNGAGKTTLVKLLARLHEPQEGRILVDGVDVRDYPVREWRRRLGAIFQDFVHYELPVRENVGFGAPELLLDDARVRSALARAGALELVGRLPRGLDTVLSRQYEDGADLSGGEWQRVAIARALMAVEGGATVLVLDEPTANLDVRAEVAFFDQFLELTRGLTTILISHRFSSVRRADRIVVLDEGSVVEEGTHAELLSANARYAQLFRLQAARFGS
jgi:ATP-binding cassette subfamily B protein